MKRCISFGLLFCFITLILAGCGQGNTDGQGDPDNLAAPNDAGQPAPETQNAPGGSGDELVIYYTTDMHGRIFANEDEGVIGLDTIAALRAETPGALLLDAGDFLHGAPAATLTEGADVVALMKQAGYTAATLGNHEFSFGRAVLDARMAEAEAEPNPMPLLSANIKQGGADFARPWLITEAAGLKVGIFGLTTQETAIQAAPDAVAGLTFEDPVASAKQAVAALQSENCDAIIALVHLGSDSAVAVKSAEVARQVEGLTAVIDGHSHLVVDEAVDGVPLVAAGEYGQQLGKLSLRLENGKAADYTNELLDAAALADAIPDAALAQEIESIKTAQQAILDEVVGSTPVTLEGEKEVVRTRETNLGNLCADVLRQAAGADVGLMNAGCIRATIPEGDISRAKVLEAFPYSNILTVKEVSGAQLADILEHACGLLPEADGRFAQVSGLSFTLNAGASPKVSNITLANGSPLDAGKTYTLATNDYVAAGGDDYPHLANLPVLALGATVEELFLDALPQMDLELYAPGAATRILQPGTGGRLAEAA